MLVKKYTIELSKTGGHHGNLLSNGSEKKKKFGTILTVFLYI